MIRFLHWLSSKLARRDIYGENGLYLSRFKILGWMPGDTRKWPFSIYLHRFHTPDQDQAAPHSHPWRWAFSIVLTGGYREFRDGAPRTRPARIRGLHAPALNVLRGDDFHVVEELFGETWTLFVVGPKTSSWGFLVYGRGVVPWRDRLAERGLKAGY